MAISAKSWIVGYFSWVESLSVVDFVPLFATLFYVIACPHTKVEESFNMQAIFDLLTFRSSLGDYDHLQFPGVVPRTFIGALVVSLISLPFHLLMLTFDLPGLYHQILVRVVLGALAWRALVSMRCSVSKVFGHRSGQLFMVMMGLQFHFNFYASRTLPNTFALVLCLWAFSHWLDGRALQCLVILAIATVVFRCDILILVAVLVIQMLIAGEIKLLPAVQVGVAVGAASLLVTVCVDSLFWRRVLWPEGVVLFFNTVENRSSEWGVMAWHWYLSSALPKALNVNLVLLPVALLGMAFDPKSRGVLPLRLALDHKALYYGLPALAFVGMYSLLPHKELRFVFPALPLVTLVTSTALARLLPSHSEDMAYPVGLLANQVDGAEKKGDDSKQRVTHDGYGSLASVAVVAMWVGAVVLSSLFLSSSMHNYPGGTAIDRLLNQHIGVHALAETGTAQYKRPIFVHIDVPAAMTGVTRFTQQRVLRPDFLGEERCPKQSSYLNLDPEDWYRASDGEGAGLGKGLCARDLVLFSKNENREDFEAFDYIITADPSARAVDGFVEVDRVLAFQRLGWTKGFFPKVVVAPTLFIMQST